MERAAPQLSTSLGRITISTGAITQIVAQTAAGVTFAGRFDERELFGADAEAAEIERTCETGAPRAVRWIVVVADPLGVV